MLNEEGEGVLLVVVVMLVMLALVLLVLLLLWNNATKMKQGRRKRQWQIEHDYY